MNAAAFEATISRHHRHLTALIDGYAGDEKLSAPEAALRILRDDLLGWFRDRWAVSLKQGEEVPWSSEWTITASSPGV